MNSSTPRFPYPSLSPGVCSNSCPLNKRCHPTISSSPAPFSSCPRFFPASGSLPVSQLFVSGGQSTGALALASVLPVNIQDQFPLGLTSLISLLSKGLSRVFFSTTVGKHQFFGSQPCLQPNSHTDTGKTIVLTVWTFIGKVVSLIFNMLSRFVIGEGNGTPHQYSCLENPMDGAAWWAAVHGIAEGRT